MSHKKAMWLKNSLNLKRTITSGNMAMKQQVVITLVYTVKSVFSYHDNVIFWEKEIFILQK